MAPRYQDQRQSYYPKSQYEGERACHGFGRKDSAQRDAKSVYGSMHQYRKEQARSGVVEYPRYDDGECDGGNSEQGYAFDAAGTGGSGPRWDQKLRQMPKSPQNTENEGCQQRTVQLLHAG